MAAVLKYVRRTLQGDLGVSLKVVLFAVFAVTLGMFPTGADAASTATGFAAFLDHAHHMVLPAVTWPRLPRRVHDPDARLGARHRAGGLPQAGPGQGTARRRRAHAVPNALLPLVSLSALNFGYVLSGAIAIEAIYSWPGLGRATFEALEGPDFPVLQGLFLLFSASVILANLAAHILMGYLDPRVRTA